MYFTPSDTIKPPQPECYQCGLSSLGYWLSENICLQNPRYGVPSPYTAL